MNRRNFLGSMVGGIAAAAAVRTWPFRVYSFPSELKILNPIVGQTLYVTNASGNYFQIGDVITVHPGNAKGISIYPIGDFKIQQIEGNQMIIHPVPPKEFLNLKRTKVRL